MSASRSGTFIRTTKKAEAERLESAILGAMSNSSKPSPLDAKLDKNELSRSDGYAADLASITSLNYLKDTSTSSELQNDYESARIRRDLNCAGMSRMQRYVSAYKIAKWHANNMRYDIAVGEGKRAL